MTYDLIVVGGGSGGIAAARRAAEFGANVLVIEKARLGGTCVNIGCVPKKVMWNAAHIADALKQAPEYGFSGSHENFAWHQIKEKRDQYIQRLNGIYKKNLEKSNVTFMAGNAVLKNSTTVEVDGTDFSSDKILLATGGRPYKLNIPGAELGSTSDDFFGWTSQPKSVAVVGAGYIGVEIAGVMKALGSEVSIVCRRSLPLSNFDVEISTQLLTHMQSQGINTEMVANIDSIVEEEGQFYLQLENKKLGPFDKILFATGRKPNTDNIGLENTQVKTNDWGHVQVDEYQNTDDPNIYAIGDIIGKIDLTPVAIAAGRKLAHRLFNKESESHLDYNNIASVVFSHPPIATIGLSENQAIKEFGKNNVTTYKSEFVNMYYAMLSDKPKSFFKLICEGENEKVVGAHAIGDGVDEMMQGFAVAIKMGASKSDFDNTVAIHPIAAEEFVTMR